MPSDDDGKANAAKAGQEKAGLAKPCPTCGKPSVEQFRPFCSSRCRDVDLNRWLTGAYAIPAVDDDDDEDGNSSGGSES